MKKMALSAVFLMLLFGSAAAHDGALSLYTDATIQVCHMDIGSFESDTIRLYYVRDQGPDLGVGVEFRLEASSVDALFLGVEWNAQINNTIGDIENGVSAVSAVCMGSNENVVYIAAISLMYMGFGERFTVRVVENPTSEPPGIYIEPCAFPLPPKYAVLGGTFVFNGTCDPGVKETSWGAIKEMYR